MPASTILSASSGLFGAAPSGYATPAEEAAAALVDLSGASTITVEDYEASAPPNLAAASALLNELASNGGISLAARAGAYMLLDSAAALALTSD
ncbi:MAG: hypothetical protein ACRDKL_09935 [Solirubrobacteraceae bacterium]